MGSEKWSAARELHREDVADSQIARFWARVNKSGECWDFTGHLNQGGYGTLVIGTKARPRSVLAHRLAHALVNGPVPARLYVLHSCDRPSCVRPAHLSLGTHEENQRQKAARGRVDVLGEHNPRARLSLDVVEAMRIEYAALARRQKAPYRKAMAARYAVSERAISAAILGENWRSAA